MTSATSVPANAKAASPDVLDAIVVGAGFAGMYQVHCLRDRLGLKVQGLEAGGGVGGTWYWNRYPGARCDTESHAYWYTFSTELMREWEWSERYPGHAEIVRYLNFVADKLDLKRNFRFNTRVAGATYDAAANLWRVRTENGDELAATFLITAVGCLSTANVPKIPGLENFKGTWYHTGQWPHEGVDFSGKRVGQIGTGSTGIQSAPVIAETAAHLTVFQRTANYSVPASNAPLTDSFRKYVKDNAELIRQNMRASANGQPFFNSDRLALETPADDRQALYEVAWRRGGLQFRGTFQDLLANKAANDTAADFIKGKIRSIVKDPRTAEMLADIDHPYAAKRPPIDTDYFETFNRDNVALVDVRANPIEVITPDGIRLRDGTEHKLDIIVFATGFDAMTGPLLRLNISGRDGVELAKVWEGGPRNYMGLQVAGFPNLFTVTGPGSPSVLCNMPVCIEQHVEFIGDAIAHMRRNGLTTIETTEAEMDKWVAEVNRAANATLLPQATHSWYLGANVPGKPRVFMPYAGGMQNYRKICENIAANNYQGFVLSA